ncbi:MAG: hypothetical protein H5U19_01365 [Rhodobacteraceae bacterium]|nr:hypothetical protein [Paracoccaceae bacterium]
MGRISSFLLAVVLAGCGGNSFDKVAVVDPGPVEPAPPVGELGDPVDPNGVTVPAVLAQNLDAAVFDPVAQTLTISLTSLDGSPVSAAYNRDTSLDVPGFQAYSIQENTTQRKFVALFRESASGNSQAGVVADGGQFVNTFGGGTFARFNSATATLPTTGLASYTGEYAGVLNTGDALPGPGAPFDPVQSHRVTGEVLLNADFNDMTVNGGIRNRQVVETGQVYDDVFLAVTGISADGAFAGVAKRDPVATMGNYGGVFAGPNASEVAGVIVVNPVVGATDLVEHGAFVIPACVGGDPSPCP